MCLLYLLQAGDGPRDDHGKSDLGLPMEANHTSSPTVHNRHTNHERRERERDSKHSQSEQKQSHDHRDGKPEHHRDLHLDRRKESYQQHPDRKALNPHHQDPKLIRKDDRRETHPSSQPQRKDAQHYSEQRERPSHHENHKRDTVEVKKENDLNGRSHSSSSATSQSRSHTDLVKLEPNRESPTARLESAPGSGSQSSTPGGTPDLPRKIKQETSAINIQEYMKRKKEKEHQEREKREREREIIEKERRERERLEKELAKLEMERQKDKRSKKVETDSLNKTFSEGSSKEQKHRPPKLDVSLPLLETKSNNKERPYEVNIKSPIKPHHNITVKSPIKSSDLKQPKLEIPKVLITPEKDGSDPFSVNINNDPAIRKLMIKQEPQSSDNESDSGNLTHVKSRQNLSSASESVSKSMIKIKQELEPGEIDDEEPEINLLPEHVAAPSVKIRELGYDPEKGLESAVALKHAMKQEHGSGRSTPVVSQSGSGSNTPLRVKLPVPGLGESSPLKIKISTKGLSTDSDHSSGKHSSPHGHKHKHKEKHKSHKHKDRHKDKHREKHSSSSSAVGTNGQSLKMSIKLSDINKHSGSGSESFSVKNKQEKQKHRLSVSDPSLTKSATLSEADRQQPWSVSALISKSGATAGINENSQESRKRRRTPTVDQNAEQPSQSKAQKMGSQRLRRSSSSHSVVSMEMSDGEDGHTNGPHIQTGANAPPQLSQLHQSLNQLISQTQKQVENMRQNQAAGRPSPGESRQPRQQRLVDRQQSGFDLEGMMWAGNSGDLPPLPTDHLAPPPPLPPSHVAPPPPPSH